MWSGPVVASGVLDDALADPRLAFALDAAPLDARRLALAAAVHAHDPRAAVEALAHLGPTLDSARREQ